jgi:FkbM family methyltransferase
MTRSRRLSILVATLAGAIVVAIVLQPGFRRLFARRDPGPSLIERLRAKYGPRQYSQWDEELAIRDFFNDRRDGFFVDVGASDYKRDSTTFYLEKHLGWTGIAIDANKAYAEGYRLNRPGTAFFNLFVSNKDDQIQDFFLNRPDPRISSGSKAHVLGFPKVEESAIELVKVPTLTLTTLLEHQKVTKVDLLSVDIEGFEPLAMEGFDLQRFKPDLCIVEMQPRTQAVLLKYFQDRGYERIEKYSSFDKYNWYFAPRRPPAPAKPTSPL